MKATISFCIFLFVYVNTEELGGKCDASAGRYGFCLKLDDCHEAIEMLKNDIRPISCGFLQETPLVCCRNPHRKIKKIRTHCFPKPNLGRQPDGTYISAGVGGFNSLAQEFPHMAALGYGDDSDIVWGCGGSLISPDFIMTAAHCLNSRSLGKVKHIRLGDLNLKRTDDDAKPQDFTVKQTYKHPSYRPPSQYNDIALIQLNRPVEINQYVRPACLNTDPEANLTSLIATGWGQLGYGAELAEHLQKMYVIHKPNSACQKEYLKHKGRKLPNGIIDSQICAGDQLVDTCAGDSGGPLQSFSISGYIIHGVTSFGVACGISKTPGVYTKVSSYIDWIDSIVWPKKDNFYEALSN